MLSKRMNLHLRVTRIMSASFTKIQTSPLFSQSKHWMQGLSQWWCWWWRRWLLWSFSNIAYQKRNDDVKRASCRMILWKDCSSWFSPLPFACFEILWFALAQRLFFSGFSSKKLGTKNELSFFCSNSNRFRWHQNYWFIKLVKCLSP